MERKEESILLFVGEEQIGGTQASRKKREKLCGEILTST